MVRKNLILVIVSTIFLVSFIFATTLISLSDVFSGTTIDSSKYTVTEENGLNITQNEKLIIQNSTLTDGKSTTYLATINTFDAFDNFTISAYVNLTDKSSTYYTSNYYYAKIAINNSLDNTIHCAIAYVDGEDFILELLNSSDNSEETAVTDTFGNLTLEWNVNTKILNCSFNNGVSTSVIIIDDDLSSESENQIALMADINGSLGGVVGYQAQTPYVTYAGLGYGAGADSGDATICTSTNPDDCTSISGASDITDISGADGIMNFSLCLYTQTVPPNGRKVLIINGSKANSSICQQYIVGTPIWNFTQDLFWIANGSTKNYITNFSADLTARISPFPANLSYNSTFILPSEFYASFDNLKFYNSSEDSINPVVSLSFSSATTTIITVSQLCTDSLSGVASCVLTSSGGTVSGSEISGLSCGTTYTITLNGTDNAGNSIQAITDMATSPCASSGGGSGGGGSTSFWKNTYVEDSVDFSKKLILTKDLGVKNRVKLNVSGETHYVGVLSIGDQQATIQVASTPINSSFAVGELKKFDLNSDGYYDLGVKLNSIDNFKANLTVTYLTEKILVWENLTDESSASLEEDNESILPSSESKIFTGKTIAIILLVIVFVLVIIGFFILSSRRKKRK